MQGLTQKMAAVQESQQAQIHRLKQLDEIQSSASEQMLRIEAKHQELSVGLSDLSFETKTCMASVGELKEAMRGIQADVGSLELIRQSASQRFPPEDDQDTLADTASAKSAKTDSDQTLLAGPNGTAERQESQMTQSLTSFEPMSSPPQAKETNETKDSKDGRRTSWQRTRPSPSVPMRPVQQAALLERTPQTSVTAGVHLKSAYLDRATLGEASDLARQIFSPRPKMPQVPLNWPSPLMQTAMPSSHSSYSPMPSPRFTSPVKSPRLLRTLSPQPMHTWQMRTSVSVRPDAKMLNSQIVSAGASKQERPDRLQNLQALQIAGELPAGKSPNSKILTPRVDNSLPATERARRVTSPTRREAKCV